MKVLFLDVDGVLNNEENYNPSKKFEPYPIDLNCAYLLGKIQLETDCSIVISSSWRHSKEAMTMLKDRFVNVIDKTPDLSGHILDERCYEIYSWLSHHPEVDQFAILDDDADAGNLADLRKHFFQTTFKEGLTEDIALAVIKHLNA